MEMLYIHHSGVLIEFDTHILIFDCYKIPNNDIMEKSEFINKYIKQTEKKVFVFVTHSHSDHYSSEVLEWKNLNSDIEYIFSDDIKSMIPQKSKDIIWVKEGDKLNIFDLNINVYGSTDLGVSFVVELENKFILHSGDLHLWHWEEDTLANQLDMKENYEKIINDIKKDNFDIDLAFVPVDPRLNTYTYEGVKYFAKNIKVKNIVPIHFWGEFSVNNEIEKQINNKSIKIIKVLKNMVKIRID